MPRAPDGPPRTTLLELFFDLVFVVSLALISEGLGRDTSWGGALHALVLLMATWWVWLVTTLVTDYYDPRRPPMQGLTIAVTLGSLLMAAAIPGAFGLHGAVFAGAYVAIHLGRGCYLIPLLRGQRHSRERAIRVFIWFAVSAVPWLAGGFAAGDWRPALWLVALAVDYAGAKLGYPVPRMGRPPIQRYAVIAEHLAERYQQFFIIALGDAVLITGIALSRTDFDLGEVAAFVLAFLITTLLWRIYVHRAGETLSPAIERSPQPERFVATAPVTQLVMVAGVVATAASFDFFITHPTQGTRTATVSIALGGPVLFLLGRARFEYEVFRRVSPNRIFGLVALPVAAPILLWFPPLATEATVAVVLAVIAVRDTVRSKGRPPEEPRPPG
ncbi:low temperature requirement protein A [Plantactinospora siamensis]|uniref:Low temperature requirement protein A n=1 Tax=Plantactinospora siamensis TaxID=555372 RepID=A0ABV6NTW0_9ACTN